MKISVAWWNTSFSPPKASPGRISIEEKEIFLDLLKNFMLVKKIDILGLCELSKNDIAWLEKECNPYGYFVQSGIIKAGRANFDTCIIYRTDKFELKDTMKHEHIELGRTTKLGLQYLFNIVGDDRPLHVFTLHWPSRINLNGWDPNRLTLGKSLRVPIHSLLEEAAKKFQPAFILVMGDFNDEPFDISITDGLHASRDRDLIQKNSYLLYNPFWRRLGGRDSYAHNVVNSNYSGTYYYTGGHTDRWRTFDQILVSSAFIGASDWHLIEEATEIVDYAPYTQKVLNNKSKFDHLPITISLEKI